ncbi:MAG: lysylphosphatidylglycerol synthase transmembrane domain-containing protein [Dehalococcoidia bacterium]
MGRILLSLVGLLIGGFLAWQVIRQVEWAEVWQELGDYPPGFLVLGLVIIMASTYVRALRWRLLYQDPNVRTFRLFLIENAAVGLNNVSPVRVLSEPVQVGLLTLRDRLSAGEVVATLGITRIFDLLVTMIALFAVLALLPELQPFWPLLLFAVLAAAVGIGALFVAALSSARIPLVKRLPVAADLKATMRSLRERPGCVALSFVLTVVQWALVCLCAWVVSQGTNYGLGPAESVAVMLGAFFFATSVPGLPVAFGTFEFAVLELMQTLSATPETALTFALLMRILVFVPQMLFAAVVLPREGVSSLAALRALLGQRSNQ